MIFKRIENCLQILLTKIGRVTKIDSVMMFFYESNSSIIEIDETKNYYFFVSYLK